MNWKALKPDFMDWFLIIFVIYLIIAYVAVANATELETIYEWTANDTICQAKSATEGIFFSTPQTEPYLVQTVTQRMVKTPNVSQDISLYLTNDFVNDIPTGPILIPSGSVPTTTPDDVVIDVSSLNMVFDSPTAGVIIQMDEDILGVGKTYLLYYDKETTGGNPVVLCTHPSYFNDGYSHAKVEGTKIETPKFSLMQAFIPTAVATTSCEFVTLGVTTTAECSDPVVYERNETLDYFYGLILTIGIMVVVLWIFKLLRQRG